MIQDIIIAVCILGMVVSGILFAAFLSWVAAGARADRARKAAWLKARMGDRCGLMVAL